MKQRETDKPGLNAILLCLYVTQLVYCVMIFTFSSIYIFDSDQLQSPRNPQYPLAHYKERLVQHDLPVPPKPFIGRNRELEQITSLFHDNKKDIISIHGPPAFGKSALAIHVGYSLLDLGMDVRYIDGSETTHFLQNKVSFELTPFFEQDAANNLVDWVRSLRHTTLLILDELDDILAHNREEFEDFINRVFQAAPPQKLKVLMTSQSHITFLDRFQQFFIGELDQRAAVDLLGELANVPVNDSQRLAEMVGFCPLTIKVVAALLNRPGMEGSAWLLAELQNNIISISCLDETLPMNHCWKAVMDIAYNKLGKEGQLCGHYVALFPGSFDEFATKNILTTPSCPNKLVVTSLVTKYTHHNQVRYIMHKLIKDYFKKNTNVMQPMNIQQIFELEFLAHYSASAYHLANYTTNTEFAKAEVYHYYFSLESHNWEELVRIALKTSSVSNIITLSVAFIHYKNLLPRNVSWLKLFHIYNTQFFENVCEMLGENVCSEVLIQTVENVHEAMPLVSCSLLNALENRGLLRTMKQHLSPSLCYCETLTNIIFHCIVIPYVALFVKCIADLFITLLLYSHSIYNRYLYMSQLIIDVVFGYFFTSSIFFYVFIHPLTILLCHIEQHITIGKLFICILICGGCVYTSYSFLLKRISRKTEYYNSLIIIILFQTFILAFDAYADSSLIYNKTVHLAISCCISIACLYCILSMYDELAAPSQIQYIHKGPARPEVIPEGFQTVSTFTWWYPIHLRFKGTNWFVIIEVFLLLLLLFVLIKLVAYIFGYTSYYPFLY